MTKQRCDADVRCIQVCFSTAHLMQYISDLKNGSTGATVIFEDSKSANSIANNPLHGQAKHITIRYHFIWVQVNNGTVELSTAEQMR